MIDENTTEQDEQTKAMFAEIDRLKAQLAKSRREDRITPEEQQRRKAAELHSIVFGPNTGVRAVADVARVWCTGGVRLLTEPGMRTSLAARLHLPAWAAFREKGVVCWGWVVSPICSGGREPGSLDARVRRGAGCLEQIRIAVTATRGSGGRKQVAL
jgi:hypothetical protein